MAITFIAIAFLIQFSKGKSDFLTGPKNVQGHGSQSKKKSDAFRKKGPSGSGHAKWSNTTPAINLAHVFHGEINRKGKPVGFHSRPNGSSPKGAKVVRVKDGPNKHGVYTATIEIADGSRWKSKFSSFFPDSLTQEQVVEAILHAYNKSNNPKKQPWRGPSGLGFDIQGYTLSKGDINTAFPIYRK